MPALRVQIAQVPLRIPDTCSERFDKPTKPAKALEGPSPLKTVKWLHEKEQPNPSGPFRPLPPELAEQVGKERSEDYHGFAAQGPAAKGGKLRWI